MLDIKRINTNQTMSPSQIQGGEKEKGGNGKVPNVVRMEKEDNHPMTFKEMAEDAIGHPYHDVLFMTGKEIRDEGGLLVHNAYMKMRTKILGPESLKYVPRKKENREDCQ